MERIEDLERRLQHARQQLVCADMIDNFGRREAQMRLWQAEVDRLERELSDAEHGFNPHGSGPVPIEPREG
ncbi:hypothetical protein [Mesorhizobium sp. DCY119]|uniref:hypothetical protein n=1 Tax=Mesorhizobium sp. DCY119 TaxID=2108445 RepID=UPI001058DDEF|nr:hypothetical protein [Mesorhizobium sp. DCY119]